jgi:DNA-binding transcriptional LysR family regulator
VGAPAYFAARGKPKRPRDLASHDCINYRRRSSGAIYRWEFTRGESELEIAVDGRLLVNDADFMLDAAVAGLGLAYLMDVSVREHLADGRLERVLERYCAPYPGFFLYYPSRAQLAPKLAALVEFLRAPVARRRAER